MSLKAKERAEEPWDFPGLSHMQRSHGSTGSPRWLSSTPAMYFYKPARNLILCSLSSKHVPLRQFLIAFIFYGGGRVSKR